MTKKKTEVKKTPAKKAATPLDRAKAEFAELLNKIEAAGKEKLDKPAQQLLNAQITHMRKYANVLAVRIANW